MSLLSLLVLRHTSVAEMQCGARASDDALGKASIQNARGNADITGQTVIATPAAIRHSAINPSKIKKGNP